MKFRNLVCAFFVVCFSVTPPFLQAATDQLLSKSIVSVVEGNTANYSIDLSKLECKHNVLKITAKKIGDSKVKLLYRSPFSDETILPFAKELSAKEDEVKLLAINPSGKDKSATSSCEKDLAAAAAETVPNGDINSIVNSFKNKSTLEISLQTADDETYNGIDTFELDHSVAGRPLESLSVSIKDDDRIVVCASNASISSSCFDVHFGAKGVFDAEGKLNTNPYYLFLARSRLGEKWLGEFNAEFYTLPQLEAEDEDATDDESEESGSFTTSGGVYKISTSFYRDIGNNFSWRFNLGAKNSPESTGQASPISKFYNIGLQHQSVFGIENGRGMSGIAYGRDDFWSLDEEGEENPFNRVYLYGKIALNQEGSIMLTTYLDFSEDGRGPAEASVTLSYGGKWNDLLKALGGS